MMDAAHHRESMEIRAPVIAKDRRPPQDHSRKRGRPVPPTAVPVDVGDERIRFEESSAR